MAVFIKSMFLMNLKKVVIVMIKYINALYTQEWLLYTFELILI